VALVSPQANDGSANARREASASGAKGGMTAAEQNLAAGEADRARRRSAVAQMVRATLTVLVRTLVIH
jgi:hypothetical protein